MARRSRGPIEQRTERHGPNVHPPSTTQHLDAALYFSHGSRFGETSPLVSGHHHGQPSLGTAGQRVDGRVRRDGGKGAPEERRNVGDHTSYDAQSAVVTYQAVSRSETRWFWLHQVRRSIRAISTHNATQGLHPGTIVLFEADSASPDIGASPLPAMGLLSDGRPRSCAFTPRAQGSPPCLFDGVRRRALSGRRG